MYGQKRAKFCTQRVQYCELNLTTTYQITCNGTKFSDFFVHQSNCKYSCCHMAGNICSLYVPLLVWSTTTLKKFFLCFVFSEQTLGWFSTARREDFLPQGFTSSFNIT